MHRKRVLLQSLLILLLVWGLVTAIRAYAGSKKITADKVAAEVNAAAFEDWSEGAGSAATAKQREEKLREIAGLVNRLDFNERERNREDRSVEQMFRLLSGDEKRLFIDLTVRESMARFMEALDKLPPAERKKFVEKGLEEIKNGKTGEELARADELGDGLLETITNEGMRAYFEKANADTKLDLAPLMESMNELMQGLRGQEFGPASR